MPGLPAKIKLYFYPVFCDDGFKEAMQLPSKGKNNMYIILHDDTGIYPAQIPLWRAIRAKIRYGAKAQLAFTEYDIWRKASTQEAPYSRRIYSVCVYKIERFDNVI